MSSSDNQRLMCQVGQWLAEKFGNVPFFVGVQPADGKGPLSISSLGTADQIRLLDAIKRSLQAGCAEKFVQMPAAVPGTFDASAEDVAQVAGLLRIMLATWPSSPRRDAFARVVMWLDRWCATVAPAPTEGL